MDATPAAPAGLDTVTATRRFSATLGRNWGWFVLRGVLALTLGIVAILFPVGALVAFTLVFAAWAGADGVVSMTAGIRGATHHQERWWALVLRGLVGIATALVFLLWPGIATLGYAMVALSMLIAWAVLSGVFEIAAAIRLRKEIEGEWLLGASGVLSILLGLVIWAMLFAYPIASILSVAWLIAGYAIVSGIALILLGLRLKRLGDAV